MSASATGPAAVAVERCSREVTAPGVRLRPVAAGRCAPPVLVPARLSSALEWDDVFDPLASGGRVVAIDLPGHGQSDKPSPHRFAYGFDAFSESVADVIATIGAPRVNLIGRGMGALIALTLAATHPDFVEKLVLISPELYASPRGWLARSATWPVFGSVFYRHLLGRGLFTKHFREQFAGAEGPNRARVAAGFVHFDTPDGRDAAHATMLGVTDTRNVVARLARITAPALVVCGRTDLNAPVADARRLARELPHGQLEVLECGRSAAEELPAAFTALALAFLEPNARASERARR